MSIQSKIKRVFICSPWRGDTERNRKIALAICRRVAMAGHNPIAPHIYYTQFLNDDHPLERQLGINCAVDELISCDEVRKFDCDATSGMRGELAVAKQRKIPVLLVALTEDEINAKGN